MTKHVIFDFDSTLIKYESLEYLLAPLLDVEKIKQIEHITALGMSGVLPFNEALSQRLAIAKPTQASVGAFVSEYCPSAFSEGTQATITSLKSLGYQVWIFSGGLADVIRPFADALEIPLGNVFAVEVEWDAQGHFIQLNNANGSATSKSQALQQIKSQLQGEICVVGDGYTDYQLYQQGLASDFIAYIEHAKRDSVLAVADKAADSMQALLKLLQA